MKTSVARIVLTAGLLQPVLLAQTPTAPGTPPQSDTANPPAPDPAPAPVPIQLVLDEAPKLSTFTAANLKFLLPQQQDLRWTKSLESSGPLSLTFSSKEKTAPAISVKNLSIGFRTEDFTPRGEYYPEPPPARPETPIKGAYTSGTLSSGEVPALLAYFKIPSERAEIWIKNQFWKDSGPLTLTGEVPGGKATLIIGGNPQDETRNWVQISINWLDETSPNVIPQRVLPGVPLPRVVPPSRR